MHGPTWLRNLVGAKQQGLRHLGSLRGRRAGAFGRRAAIALLGVILLCGASAAREFEISIRDRRVEGLGATIRVKRGETVLLPWRTDEAVSLHVHGYDLYANLSAGSPKTIRFEATVAGLVPISAHEFGTTTGLGAGPKSHREVTLLYLEVLPE